MVHDRVGMYKLFPNMFVCVYSWSLMDEGLRGDSKVWFFSTGVRAETSANVLQFVKSS